MSEKSTALAQRRAAVIEVANRIDETAAGAMVHFKSAGSMAAELQVAQAMADLRAMLTPEVMAPIMALMDSDIGFRTDRDPKQENFKTKQPNEPYGVDVIRDVIIESKLRGFHTVGNEFNVIAGRFYGAKAGFRRKLTDGKTFPGLTNFRDTYEVPRLVGDKGAIVKCKASWVMNGKPESFECEFAVKVNGFMGADAITGKAERKLCKRVHDLLSGVNTPDGEVGDDAPMATVTHDKTEPIPTFKPKEKAAAEATPAKTTLTEQQTKLADIIHSEGCTFDTLLFVCGDPENGVSAWKHITEGCKSIFDMKPENIEQLLSKERHLRSFLVSAKEAGR